jgi:hypothetical protein
MPYVSGAGLNTQKICLEGTRREILDEITAWAIALRTTPLAYSGFMATPALANRSSPTPLLIASKRLDAWDLASASTATKWLNNGTKKYSRRLLETLLIEMST